MEVCSTYMFGKLMQKDDFAIREIVPSLIRLGRVFSEHGIGAVIVLYPAS